MTWSIVARDPADGAFGIAISTCAFAVGALCPWIREGVGALSSQAYANPMYGSGALAHMVAGEAVGPAIEAMIAGDAGRDWRQVHGVDAAGRVFAYTGVSCIDWCGHRTGDQYSVAGNMLAGPAVVGDSFDCYGAGTGREFADRLLCALEAGQAAGGDKRGRQSAALLIKHREAYALVDLRVDDHPDPIGELRRLYLLYRRQRWAYMQTLASSRDPAGIYHPDARAAFIAERERELDRAEGAGPA